MSFPTLVQVEFTPTLARYLYVYSCSRIRSESFELQVYKVLFKEVTAFGEIE
jgi:hypothetical protein